LDEGFALYQVRLIGTDPKTQGYRRVKKEWTQNDILNKGPSQRPHTELLLAAADVST
jgi:hypothetical protein